MYLNPCYFALLLSSLAIGIPLDGSANLPKVARAKSYAIVNVDGGSTAAPSSTKSSTTQDHNKTKTKTKTVEITYSALKPTASTKPSSSKPVGPTITPSTSVVTVIITESASPSSYYDNGMWHTNYPVKTWGALTTMPPTPKSL